MNNKEKRARFRELAQHDWRIRTARELAEELDQPFLPLFNDYLKATRPAWSVREGQLTPEQARRLVNGE